MDICDFEDDAMGGEGSRGGVGTRGDGCLRDKGVPGGEGEGETKSIMSTAASTGCSARACERPGVGPSSSMSHFANSSSESFGGVKGRSDWSMTGLRSGRLRGSGVSSVTQSDPSSSSSSSTTSSSPSSMPPRALLLSSSSRKAFRSSASVGFISVNGGSTRFVFSISSLMGTFGSGRGNASNSSSGSFPSSLDPSTSSRAGLPKCPISYTFFRRRVTPRSLTSFTARRSMMSSWSSGVLYFSASCAHTSSRRRDEARHASSRPGSSAAATSGAPAAALGGRDGPGVDGALSVRARFGGGGRDVDLRRGGAGGGGVADGVLSGWAGCSGCLPLSSVEEAMLAILRGGRCCSLQLLVRQNVRIQTQLIQATDASQARAPHEGHHHSCFMQLFLMFSVVS